MMYKYYETSFKNQSLSLKEKFFNLSFSYIVFICILAATGIVVLYSAANGNWSPWAFNPFWNGIYCYDCVGND